MLKYLQGKIKCNVNLLETGLILVLFNGYCSINIVNKKRRKTMLKVKINKMLQNHRDKCNANTPPYNTKHTFCH